MAKYLLTNKAVEDLADIWNYTVNEWSERQADDYYTMLIASCQKIADHPERFGKRYDEIMAGLRGFKANRHIIFYRTVSTDKVEIIRILHSRMDIPDRLKI